MKNITAIDAAFKKFNIFCEFRINCAHVATRSEKIGGTLSISMINNQVAFCLFGELSSSDSVTFRILLKFAKKWYTGSLTFQSQPLFNFFTQ